MSKFHRHSFLRGKVKPKKKGEMNATERRYVHHLEEQKLLGEILWFRYEPFTLNLTTTCTYSPDFLVMTKDGFLECHEVKGTMITKPKKTGKVKAVALAEPDSIVRIKFAAEIFPFTFKRFHMGVNGWEMVEYFGKEQGLENPVPENHLE